MILEFSQIVSDANFQKGLYSLLTYVGYTSVVFFFDGPCALNQNITNAAQKNYR